MQMIKLRNTVTKFIGFITILSVLFGGAIVIRIGYIEYSVIMLTLAIIIAFGYYLQRNQLRNQKNQ
jgi:hypothetical protein